MYSNWSNWLCVCMNKDVWQQLMQKLCTMHLGNFKYGGEHRMLSPQKNMQVLIYYDIACLSIQYYNKIQYISHFRTTIKARPQTDPAPQWLETQDCGHVDGQRPHQRRTAVVLAERCHPWHFRWEKGHCTPYIVSFFKQDMALLIS